jgi:acetyl esterase/lipase
MTGVDQRTRYSLLTVLALALCTGVSAAAGQQPVTPPRLMGPQDLQALPSSAPDARVSYGGDSSQYGELRVPAGPGPHPVAVLVHGGCFKAAYANAHELGAMADSLEAMGIATWNVEYRRLGQPGGGWPNTYLDVGRAVDHLRTLAPRHRLDLAHVVLVGHSAGGHLAMWAAARRNVPRSSALYVASPLHVRAVVDLAGPLDMQANIAGYEAGCRDSVITTLFGGMPTKVPERYAHASPKALLPLGVPQAIVVGEHEEFLPRSLAEAYVAAAARAGDHVDLVVIPAMGHFELAMPTTPAWPTVAAVIRAMVDGKPYRDGAGRRRP